MGELVGIVGRSGTGKTTSVLGLDPKETFLITITGKRLPDKDINKLYVPVDAKGNGNYLRTTSAKKIADVIDFIDKNRPDIKVIVIDDYQYIMGFEFFEKAEEKGYDKFSSIGKNAVIPLIKARGTRDNLIIFVLTHEEEISENFKPLRKMKTIGKMVDEKFTLEGVFETVLFTHVKKEKDKAPEYTFITNSDGSTTAKSAPGMFAYEIANNLGDINKTIREFYSI